MNHTTEVLGELFDYALGSLCKPKLKQTSRSLQVMGIKLKREGIQTNEKLINKIHFILVSSNSF